MQPPTSWTDLENSRVGVWGYGVEGKATVLSLQAIASAIVIVDDGLADESEKVLSFDVGGFEALSECDYVIKSPGISRYGEQFEKLAQNVPVLGAAGIWLNSVNRDKVVCVTGTKGKSTTSALCAEILSSLGHNVFLGGNIGEPPWAPDAQDDWDYWVMETSSYQVMDLQLGPRVIGLTSLHSDHLPWHRTSEQYFADKLSITKLPGAQTLVYNSDDEQLAGRSEIADFEDVSLSTSRSAISHIPEDSMALRGTHNRSNAALAIQIVESLTGDTGLAQDDIVVKAVQNFAGLEHRFQTVASTEAIDFINDSLSTNPLPTIAALEALIGETIAVILGGYDRGVDQADLIDYLASRGSEVLLVCIPDTGKEIFEKLSQRDVDCQLRSADNLTAATELAYEWVKDAGGGVVLLSPAAASFNAFNNYKERGNKFAELAQNLVGQQA